MAVRQAAVRFVIAALLSLSTATSQQQDPADDAIIGYMNNAWAFGMKHGTPESIQPAVDSCWRFLRAHPGSWIRPSLFAMMLKSQSDITRNKTLIYPLIDSVLSYDSLPGTQLNIGELLITRNIDHQRGRTFLDRALPGLTVPRHLFRYHSLMAQLESEAGNISSAQYHHREALRSEPTRQDGWYSYLAFLKATEQTDEYALMAESVRVLDQKKLLEYSASSGTSPLIGRSLAAVHAADMTKRSIRFAPGSPKITVLIWFNFWCSFCGDELRVLPKLQKEFPQVRFVFVDINDTQDELTNIYFRKKPFRFLHSQQVIVDSNAAIPKALGLNGSGVPRTVILDKDGVIRFDLEGYRPEFLQIMRERLKEMSAD